MHPKAAHSWNSSLLRETLAQGCLGEQCTHLRGPKKMLGAELAVGRGEPVELVLTRTGKAVQWHTWPFSSKQMESVLCPALRGILSALSALCQKGCLPRKLMLTSRPPSWRGYHHRNSSGCPDVARMIPAPLQPRYLLHPGKRILSQPCCPSVAPAITVWSGDAMVISLLQVGTVVSTEGQEPSALGLGPGLSSRLGRPDLEITS